jgi:hypothetical protein
MCVHTHTHIYIYIDGDHSGALALLGTPEVGLRLWQSTATWMNTHLQQQPWMLPYTLKNTLRLWKVNCECVSE